MQLEKDTSGSVDSELHFRQLVEAFPPEVAAHWRPLRLLGRGWEGTVYLVQDTKAAAKSVLKIFHRPLHERWTTGLQTYADGVVNDDCPGLYPINLIQTSGQVLGLVYPYHRLYQLNRRLFWSVDQFGQALVGSYCRMQEYLITEHGLGLWDVSVDNFRMDKYGQFWLTDLGYGVASLDNRKCASLGLFEYGFVMLLLSIHDINIRVTRPYSRGYTYSGPCRYCAELTDLASRHKWIRSLMATVHNQRGAVFLAPEFYRQMGDQLPRRISWPVVVIAASEFLSRVARLRVAGREKGLSMIRALRSHRQQ